MLICSLRLPLCLIFDPQMIAAACMLLAFKAEDEVIPTGTDTIWGRTLEQEPGLLAGRHPQQLHQQTKAISLITRLT